MINLIESLSCKKHFLSIMNLFNNIGIKGKSQQKSVVSQAIGKVWKLINLSVIIHLFYVLYLMETLVSQSSDDEEYIVPRWVQKKQNASQAQRRKEKNLRDPKKAPSNQEKKKKKKCKPLKSQVGIEQAVNWCIDAPSDIMDLVGSIWLTCREFISSYEFSIPDWRKYCPTLGNVEDIVMAVKDSEILSEFITLVQILVTLGVLRKVNVNYKGMAIISALGLNRATSLTELLTQFYKLLKLLSEKIALVVSTKNLMALFQTEAKSAYDQEYSFLISQATRLEIGRACEVDIETYDRRIFECIEKTVTYLNGCKQGERSFYAARLTKLKELQTARVLAKKENIRIKPYGVLLFGDSGVGKSAIVNALIRYILQVNKKDHSPGAIVTLNQEDKFQSEFMTHHKGVILDDICNTSLDRVEGSPTTPVIMFLNQVPMAALNPNAEMKGKIMIEPDVVCATTNVKDLKSNMLSNEPLSINRRFEVTITQTVKEEYRKKGTTMLDNNKIKHMATQQFPDYALFTVEEPRYKEDLTGDKTSAKRKAIAWSPIYYKGKPLENVEIDVLLSFLREDSANHFAKQEAFVSAQKNMVSCELCVHQLPPCVCKECSLESQVSIPYYEEVREFLERQEDKFVALVEKILCRCLETKFGQLLLMYQVRKDFLKIVWNACTYYLVYVCTLLISEATGNVVNLKSFLGVTLGFCMYLACRYYILVETIRKKWTRCQKPSVYLRQCQWLSYRTLATFLVAVGVWKLLVELVKKYNALPTKQAAEPVKLVPNMKAYQQVKEFWDEKAMENKYKLGDITHSASKTMTTEQCKTVIGKRLAWIKKQSNGEYCNAMPIRNGVFIVPNHIIPKDTDFVDMIRADGRVRNNNPISVRNTQKIAGTDLALWYVPSAGDDKNLIHLFPEHLGKDKVVEVVTVYNDKGQIRHYDTMMARSEMVVTTAGGFFKGLKYHFPVETFGGLCMATLIGNANGAPFIAGYHLAGRGHTGAAGVVTRDQIESALLELEQKNIVLVSHTEAPLRTQQMGVDFGPLKEPHYKCVTNHLPKDAKIDILGGHNQPSSEPKSAVVTSLISKAVSEIMGIPKQHGPPKEMSAARHKEVDIAGKVDTASKFDDKFVEAAYLDYSKQLLSVSKSELKQLGKISDDANLAGMDGVLGINAMNFTTSMGFPLKGPKTQYVSLSERNVEGIACPRDVDDMILNEVKFLEQELLAGRRVNAIFKASLKDEPTKLTKDKVRVFAAANMPFTMLVRKYFLTLAALFQRNKELTECAVGIVVQSPEWTQLYAHIGKYGWERGIAGDYAKFDGRMSAHFMMLSFKILIEMAKQSGNYDADDLKIMQGIATEISYPTYDYFGTIVQFAGSNPSGHPLTVIINSMVNSLYIRYTYYAIAAQKKWWRIPRFSEVVSLMTYGDDNIMSVKKGYEDFNHTEIAKQLAEVGITYTMAEKDAASVPFIHLSEASFLKHFAVWDPELKLYRSPVEEASIAKMLHTHKLSKILSKEQSSAEAIQNVALKFFEFGREIYEQKRTQLEQVADASGIRGYVGSLPSYDERLAWYREKFELLDSQSGKDKISECCVNSEEEQLQLKCIAEMPLRLTYKEYLFPGGRSGDLLFIDHSMKFVIVVEVKVCGESGKKFNKAKKQAESLAGVFHLLYPTHVIYGIVYTNLGFRKVVQHGQPSDKVLSLREKIPFDL